MEEVIHLGLDEVAHIFIDAHPTIGNHGERTELDLCLTLKHRLFHIDSDGCHEPVADIAILIVLLRELLDGLCDMLFECTLMRTSLGSVLSVDEGVIFLTILVGMGEGYLNVLSLEMDNGIDAVGGHRIIKEVFQSVPTQYASAIIHDGQTSVEVGVVTEHSLDDVVMKGVVDKEGLVGLKEDICAVLICRIFGHIARHHTLLEGDLSHLPFPIRLHLEVGTEGIHRLHTHAVESHAFLESLGVVFTTSVKHTDSLNEFTLWDTASIVTYAHPEVIVDIHFDTRTCMHLKLIDRVVYHLLK